MRAEDDSDELEPDDPQAEQDLLVVLRLSNRAMGTAAERAALAAFADDLEQAVLAAGVGEYDGDEIGGGEAVLFFCGPDVDRLQRELVPLLRRSPLCRGGHLVRMVKAADGSHARQRLPI